MVAWSARRGKSRLVANYSGNLKIAPLIVRQCDEGRPSCARCNRRKEECHYKDTITPGYSPEPHSAARSLGSDTPQLSAGFFGEPIASPLDGDQIDSSGRLPNPDLELLHHFTISTSLGLSGSRYIQDVWQNVAPQEAFSQPFLMRGLLAISALHLAHLRPAASGNYHNLAIEHYTSALRLLRTTLNDIHSDNAVPAFLLSGLLVCISSAMPQDPSQPVAPPFCATSPLQYFLDTFHLQRGIKQVLSKSWSWVRGGVLSPIINLDFNDTEASLPSHDEAALNIIEERIPTECESETKRSAYTDAVLQIRKCFPLESRGGDRQPLVFAWPVIVSPEFFNEMLEKRPVAIAILCYYGTLLDALKHIWWTGARGRKLVSATSELLGPEWETLTKWATVRVGLS